MIVEDDCTTKSYCDAYILKNKCNSVSIRFASLITEDDGRNRGRNNNKKLKQMHIKRNALRFSRVVVIAMVFANHSIEQLPYDRKRAKEK